MPDLKACSGIEWSYDIKGEGEPLLFIHGWGVDKRIWRQQVKYFSERYLIITVDLPGHGESDWQKISLETMCRDLNDILEHVDVRQISIISSSFGGMLALKFYDLFSEKIKRLIFVGFLPKFSRSSDYPYGLDVDRIRKLNRQLETDYPSIVNIFFRSLFTKEERASRRFRWIQNFKKREGVPNKKALSEYLDILEKEDLRDVLKKIDVPSQFINGEDDYICDSAAVLFLKGLSPHSRYDVLKGKGHFPFLIMPYEFNKLLEIFLKGY